MHNPGMDNMEKYPTDAWRVGKGGGRCGEGRWDKGWYSWDWLMHYEYMYKMRETKPVLTDFLQVYSFEWTEVVMKLKLWSTCSQQPPIDYGENSLGYLKYRQKE